MEKTERLKESINGCRKERRNAQKMWSGVHHLSLFGSIVCSIVAAAWIQTSYNTIVATILTSTAAALTGIASSGGFERKWRSNRLSRSKADCLLVDIDCDDADLAVIRKQYKSAIEKHDLEVVGDRKEEYAQ